MAEYDILIDLNDTLELDTIIKKWDDPSSPLNSGQDEDKFNISGIQTNTTILDPKESGTHTLDINGQTLKVKVTNPNKITEYIDNFEDGSISEYNGDTNNFTVDSTRVWNGEYSLRCTSNNSDIITDTTNLNVKPTQDEIIRYYYSIESISSDDRDHVAIFCSNIGANDGVPNNGLFARFNPSDNRVGIGERSGGTSYNRKNKSWNPETKTWYHADMIYKSDETFETTFYKSSDNSEIANISTKLRSDHIEDEGVLFGRSGNGYSGDAYFDSLGIR